MEKIIQYQELILKELEGKRYGAAPRELYEPIEYIMSLGGKRMRPVLVLMGCELFGGDVRKALSSALAIELFHNFTLVHDDIMDNAPLRRNKATVHEKWNPNIAILSGDAMMVCAYQELCKADVSILPSLLRVFSDTAVKVCEGQQFDMNFEKQNTVSIPQYLKMIELKTAVLLGGALQIGAISGGARDEDALRLYEFGKHVGIAFQLQDDILDVFGDADKFGKQTGGDIIANKKTYLLLKAIEMAENNRYMKEELQMWLAAPEFDPKQKVEAVTGIYNFLNVRELARKEMDRHYNKALKMLGEIPVSEEKKAMLTGFCDQLMDREI